MPKSAQLSWAPGARTSSKWGRARGLWGLGLWPLKVLGHAGGRGGP